MKKIVYLVTGATGFLGSNVCSQLLERGDKVKAFVMPNDKAIKFVPRQVEICEGDLCNKDSLKQFVLGAVPQHRQTRHCRSHKKRPH